jgi:2-dehydropantoate 2-reductase
MVIAGTLAQAGQRVSVFSIEPEKSDALRHGPIVVSGCLNAKGLVAGVYESLDEFLRAKPEVVLIATKSCDSPELLSQIARLKPNPETIWVSCQNGLDVERYIAEVFGEERTLRMVLHMGCQLMGDVRNAQVHIAFLHTHVLSDRVQVREGVAGMIAQHFTNSGMRVMLAKDYRREVFKKAILNASLSTVCALTGFTMQGVLQDPALRAIVERIVRESILIAESEGVALGDAFFGWAMDYLMKGGDHRPSMLVDVERGRRTENEDHCGRLHHCAVKNHVEDATIHTVYALMRNLEGKNLCKR